MKSAYETGKQIYDAGAELKGKWDERPGKVDDDSKPFSCWLKTSTRGWGHALSACREGEEKSGLICYPQCQQGYTGVGPVCWQDCPQGMRVQGAFCAKAKPYGRGTGHTSEETCKQKEHGGSAICEKWGMLWYPKCDQGYYAFACCVCEQTCPEGMADVQLSCTKKSSGRGVGKPMICDPKYEQSGLLCYPKCDAGRGVGPVCWGYCPEGTKQCGVLCLSEKETCLGKIGKMTMESLSTVGFVASQNYPAAAMSAAGVVIDLVYPICSMWNAKQG